MVSCTFAGHREIFALDIERQIKTVIEGILPEDNTFVFYSGDMGEFDKRCSSAVRNIKRCHPELDTFTRAFYREFGLNPSDYMKNPVPVPFFIPYGAKYRELRKENIDLSNIQPIFIQVVRKPERLCIIKRGRQAADYFPYCEEVSCDVWGILMSMKSLCGEPVSMWLPEKYKKPNTSTYVQGVEVETDYMGMIPEGFDTIHLPEAEYLMFQGPAFREEDYCEAIRTVQAAMDSYDPSVIGYRWDDENPRIQLEPRGQRGYIELRAVRRVQK